MNVVWGIARVGVPVIALAAGIVLTYRGAQTDDAIVSVKRPCTEHRRAVQDCGPACLYIICKLEDRAHSLDSLRELTRTTVLGTRLFDLKAAAAELGFLGDVYQGSFADLLRHLKTAHSYGVIYEGRGHFVAIIGVRGTRTIRIADPVMGIRDMDENEFRNTYSWTGVMLLMQGSNEQA